MALIRFVRPYRPSLGAHYMIGDVATFPEEVAAALIADGTATPEAPPLPTKALDRPPVDRQIVRPTKHKHL